jgi:CheY-like chemotaxis protein
MVERPRPTDTLSANNMDRDPQPMGKPLRLLMVEDSPLDAELLVSELKRCGYDLTYERVDTKDAMRAALDGDATWDLVLSDYSMPTFSAPEALRVLQATRHEVPFIIVSGTVGEETAVAALKAGADDFLLKDRLARLAPAIERELQEAAERRERQLLKDAIVRHEAQMEGERLRVVKVTMRTVQDIVNNCLNQLQLLRLAAEGHVPEESLLLFDQTIQDTSAKLTALGDMEVFVENLMEIGTGLHAGGTKTS